MSTTMSDAQLVADHLAGDRGAFAAMYDRYGATLYDTAAAMTRHREDAADITQDVFVVAAERMSQLRDPTRLKPWLFAILRNEVYRRTGRRKRVVPTDFTEPVAEMNLPTEQSDEAADLEYQELAELVRGAAFGLDERDRLVLEYSIRQGLQGEDLAAALGVTAQQSYGMVHRMRQRTERSLGAYCVARRGRKECDELARILADWDGEFSVLIRKRVARHIDGCDICERSRRTFAPLALFGAAPAFAAPADLRDRVLGAVGRGAEPGYAFSAPGGFPAAVAAGRRLGLWVTLATLALLFVGGTTAWVLASEDDGLEIVDGSSTTTATSAVASSVASSAEGAPGADGSTTASSSTATTSSSTSSSTTTSSTTSSTTSTSTTTTTTTTTITTATTTVPIVVTLPPTTPPATTTAPPPPPTTTMPATTTTPTTTVPPGSLAVSAGSIDFGTTLGQARVRLTNVGGRPVDWSATTGPAGFRRASTPFTFAPAGGTLAAGAAVDVIVSFDRTWPTEGPVATTRLTFAASGTSAAVDLDGEIARIPAVRSTSPPSMICSFSPAGPPNPLVAQASVIDESAPLAVRFVADNPAGMSTSVALAERAGTWAGSVATDLDRDGQPDAGLWTWTIEATDAFGNVGTASGTTEIVPTFC